MYTQKRDNVTKVAEHAVLVIVVLTVSEFWSLRRTPKFGRVSVVSGPSDNAAIPSGSSHGCPGGELLPPQSTLPLLPSEASPTRRFLWKTAFSRCPEDLLSTWSYATCRQPLGWHPKACQGFATFLGWHPAATKSSDLLFSCVSCVVIFCLSGTRYGK